MADTSNNSLEMRKGDVITHNSHTQRDSYLFLSLFFLEISETYLTTVRRIRATLDDIEDIFLDNPEVPLHIYNSFETQILDINKIFADKFLDAFCGFHYEEMKQVNDALIEAVIIAAENFLESEYILD